MFWPFSLFGNPGAETGVQELHESLCEAFRDYGRETVCQQHGLVAETRIEIWDYNELKEYGSWQSDLRRHFKRTLDRGEFPIFIGGNHLAVLPILEAYAADTRRICVVSFDAHLDIYRWSQSKEVVNHGNFLLHLKRGENLAIVNVGHRELSLSSTAISEVFAKSFGIDEIVTRGIDGVIEELRRFLEGFDAIHIDLDVDVFDQATFRATGCPTPFGLTGRELLKMLVSLWSEKLIGISISEYNGLLDVDASGKGLLLWLLDYILLRRPRRATKQDQVGKADDEGRLAAE